MSKFSTLLGNIVKENNISVYSLSKELGCGRTWLQKVLSGERHMDLNSFVVLRKILMTYVDGIGLDYLYEPFAMDYFGQSEYRVITYIKERLLETQRLEDYIRRTDKASFRLHNYLAENCFLDLDEDEKRLAEKMEMLLIEEIQDFQSGQGVFKLYIHIPSKWKYLKNLLLTLLSIYNVRYTTQFKYIADSGYKEHAELIRIENFLTAAEFASYGFNSYVDESISDWQTYSDTLFPYYVITAEKLLIITDDGRTFIETTEKDVIDNVCSRFERVASEKKMFMTAVNAGMYNSVVMDRGVNDIEDYFEISNSLNIDKFYSTDDLRRILPTDYADREFMIQTLDTFFETLRNTDTSTYFTLDSVRHFMENGQGKEEGESASEFTNDISNNIKLQLLKKLCEYYKAGNGSIHMLKAGQYLASDHIHIFGWKEKVICVTNTLYGRERGLGAMAVVQSPAIARHLYHYDQYIMNSQICLDKDNSLKVLENLIRAYEDDGRFSA